MINKKQLFFSIIAVLITFSLFQPYFWFDFGFSKNNNLNQSVLFAQSSASGRITCSDITQTSIKVNYTYSGLSNGFSLWRQNTLLTFSPNSNSGGGAYHEVGLSPNTSYTYYLRHGLSSSSPTLDVKTCTTTGVPTCTNECSYGARQCLDNYRYKVCGNYDSDPCSEWSDPIYCPSGQICSGGQCITPAPTCTDECSSSQRRCYSSTHYQACGNYDSDPCLEWSGPISCPSGQVCQNGQCVTPPPTCQDECSFGQTEKRCSGNYLQERTCGNYDSDPCLEWSSWFNLQDCGTDSWTDNYRCQGNWVQREKIKKGCSGNQCYSYSQWEDIKDCLTEGKVCQNGQCLALVPEVDLKANNSDGSITLHYQDYVTLSWTSSNAATCQALGDWSGSKPVSGTESIQLIQVKTYHFTLSCQDLTGTKRATDSVEVIVKANLPTVITKPAVVSW